MPKDIFPQEEQTQQEDVTLFANQNIEEQDTQSQTDEVLLENVANYRYWIYIDGVDRSGEIDWRSWNTRKKQNRTPEVTFDITADSVAPDMLADVVLYVGETASQKVFGGVVTRTSERYERRLRRLTVECQGYEFLFNSSLVVGEFSGTVSEVVRKLVSDHAPAGFTTKGVVDMTEKIEVARYNHEKLTDVLNNLADKYNMSWYITPDKDVRFFDTRNAPFDLSDDNDNYDWRSLVINNDIEELANSIIVRGGYFVEDFLSEEDLGHQVDGENTIFKLGFRYQNPKFFVNGVEQDVGILNLHSFENYDALYSDREKNITVQNPLTDSDKPVIFKGNRKVPVRSIRRDNESIEKFGQVFQTVIVDESIEDQDDAWQRALAELNKFANELSDATFTTKRDWLEIGDIIRIQSDIRSLDEEYVVNSISMQGFTPKRVVYSVGAVLKRKKDFIDTMKDLIRGRKERIGIGEDEALEFLEEINEAVGWDESFDTDPWGEDTIPTWVAGPYIPTGPTDEKRSPNLDSGAEAS